MSRLAFASLSVLVCALCAFSADPTPVEKQLAIQSAMASARKHLDTGAPAEAVASLEKEVTNADGNKAFLDLLREAYTAELSQLEKTPGIDPERIAQTRRKLTLIGGQSPTGGSPSPLAPPKLP